MPSTPPVEPGDLNLLRVWSEPVSARSLARDAIASLLIHALFIGLLIFVPDVVEYRRTPDIFANFKEPTRLILPRDVELTAEGSQPGEGGQGHWTFAARFRRSRRKRRMSASSLRRLRGTPARRRRC